MKLPFSITIAYGTDGMDGKTDHIGIATEVGKAFPDIARPYVKLEDHTTVLKLPSRKKKDNRSSKMADARKRATQALSIIRDPISKEYRLFLGAGKGKDLKLTIVAQFTIMDKTAKKRIRSIREAVAGLIAGMPSWKYKKA